MACIARIYAVCIFLLGFAACNPSSTKSSTTASAASTAAQVGLNPCTTTGSVVAATGQAVPAGITAAPITTNANAVPYVGTTGGPNNAFTLVGRFDAANAQAPRFSLPNSKIGGTFTGDTLSLILNGDGTDYLSVIIDNGAEHVIATAPTTAMTTYPVASGLGAGSHVAWVIKRTESDEQSQVDANVSSGALAFGGFALATGGAMAAPPAPRSHLVIALGDSGFTGYGVGQLITPDQNCVYTPATQNALLSVPAKLADLLGAEIINVSQSGKGIAASAFDPGNDNDQLPALWQMAVPPSSTPAYAFESLPVDVVLLNGGSDDLVGVYGAGVIADSNVFIAKYTALLADMRAHYPTALIVGIVTPNAIDTDKTILTTMITASVAARAAAGDARVYYFDYFTQDPNGWTSYNDADAALNLGHGCQGHPSDAGGAFLAGRLATFLRAHQPAAN